MKTCILILVFLSQLSFAADKKISDLTLLPAGSWDVADVFAIVDSSAVETKKTRVLDFDTRYQLAGGYLTGLSGDVTASGPGVGVATISSLARTKLANGDLNRLVVNNGTTGAVADAAPIAGLQALASDVDGIPVASSTTAAELAFVSGVTSNLQTQLGNITTQLSANVSSATHGNDCSFARTNTAYGNTAADATCTFTQTTTQGLSCVSDTATNNIAGVVCTPTQTGIYLVSARFQLTAPNNTEGRARLFDGTNTLAQQATLGDASTPRVVVLAGMVTISAVAAFTIDIQLASPSGAVTIASPGTVADAITWNVQRMGGL